jgi:hypothetical protein
LPFGAPNDDGGAGLPETIVDETQLDELLSRPTDAAVRAMVRLDGDILILGAGGKMGPSLARMAQRASAAANRRRRIIAASRFSDSSVMRQLQTDGVETLQGDLLCESFLDSLPHAENVIYMAGMKFGSTQDPAQAWAANAYLPALVARRFAASRIVAFSTGNVYPLVPNESTGSVETDLPAPVGEYAMSCLGRERIFEYFSKIQGMKVALLRLNYANELRYGVLVDLALKVFQQSPIELAMGYVNVIWQGDANAMALCALPDTASPPLVLNVAGRERLQVRQICDKFGQLMKRELQFVGSESPTSLLSHGEKARQMYGVPTINSQQMIRWIAAWIQRGGATLGKPTHFDERDGKF